MHSLEHHLATLPVGVSIGFAEREPEDQDPPELLARADSAMYRQKQTQNETAQYLVSRYSSIPS
jgi:GGDEF domain-containing protein